MKSLVQRGPSGRVASQCGGDQNPLGRTGSEGSFNTAERTNAGMEIGDHGMAKDCVAGRIADNRDRTARACDHRRNVGPEPAPAKRQKGLVGAHAARLATGQQEPRNGQRQPDPLAALRVAAIIKANTFMRISLVTVAAALTAIAANPAHAAPRLKNPTSVVRVSPQGKLVRTVVTPATLATTASNVDTLVEELAAEHRVDPLLVQAVIRVESNYNQFALSDKGAQGYMQLIPQTAREMGVRNVFDPRENITGGVKYLRAMMDRFTDLRHVIAAYNAGPEAVERFGGIPPYTETQNYVYLVAEHYNRLRREHPLAVQVAESKELTAEPEHRPLVAYTDAEGRLHLETQ